ncbi:alpha/beta hydrolase [Enterococcus sp. DIV0660C]|uniref:alpha/beta hydrolase n=1 Tax=Enterococcus sp. DIV0660C TaxID=2230880 RepID=UPI001A8E29ED|nr:alpha/beta hydrolase [Enterococcus sp. DIV0660C]MBO0431912.1 alpha/beta hydrolase [Enterococcus sp. DIV0660C]
MYTQKITFDPHADTGLTLYLNDQLVSMDRIEKRPFILVIPGGGYSFCSEREAEPIALAFVAKGYHAGVLRYHVGEQRDFEQSLQDGERALIEIKKIDPCFKVAHDQIAVIGFSAGGHLAAAMSTLLEEKPALCILGYPAILASFAEVMKIEAPSLDACVTPETPPTFLFSTFEDNVVPIENSLLYLAALEANDVPFESHIFQKGLHGLSLATKWFGASPEMIDERFARWFELAYEWLELNWSQPKSLAQGEEEESLKPLFEQSLQHLMKEKRIQELLIKEFPKLSEKSYYKIIRKFTLNQLHRLAPEIFSSTKLTLVQEKIEKNF